MTDRVFCIDLGNSFTKVGLRRGRRANSEVIADPRLTTLDELKLCIPTTVAIDYGTSPAKPIFGDAALDRRPGKTLRVFSNWKKELFAEATRSNLAPSPTPPSAPAPRTPSRLETLISSAEFLQFAARYGVPPADVNRLQRLFTAAADVLAPPAESGPHPVQMTTADSDGFKVAVLFFRHLRQVVLDSCRGGKSKVESPELIPARLAVPAFAPEDELPALLGCRWLAEAMTKAGWVLVPHRPIVSEPYANAIGVLTQGSNCTRERDMLQNGLLAKCLAQPKDHPEYRAVVIDVGAFTVDFATLTYRSGGKDQSLDEVEFERREVSVPLGVSELDAAVLGVIPHNQVVYLRDQAPAIEWADFRPRVYAERQPFPTPAGEVGAGGDAKRIDDVIQTYTTQLAEQAAKFLAGFPDVGFKELILTGGGSTIPAVRDALIRGAEAGRENFRKIHLPAVAGADMRKKSTAEQPVVTIEGKLARGGTALGGSGAFFDMDRAPYPIPAA